jgi:SAM-dependent methyltransferase
MSAKQFDEYAHSYGVDMQQAIALFGQEHEYFTRRKVEVLLDLTGRRVGEPGALSFLDVGCGIGQTDALLAPHVGRLRGADPSAESIARAAEGNPAVAYDAYDGATLPYSDGSFDVVFAICVMHHVDLVNRRRFACELRRVVRPGGVVAVFEHNPYNPATRHVVRNCPFDDGVVLLNRRTVRRLLLDAGLEPVEERYIIFSPFDRQWIPRVERRLGWLPAGAQHYVAATATV